jgi:hypothetical protein
MVQSCGEKMVKIKKTNKEGADIGLSIYRASPIPSSIRRAGFYLFGADGKLILRFSGHVLRLLG